MPGILWSRVYLIEDESLALVDAGLPWSTGPILRYIKSIGRSPNELRWILMTHSHPDHAGGATAIVKRTGASIIAHADDTKTHADQQVSLSYMGAFTSLKLPLPFLQRAPVSSFAEHDQVLPLLGGIRVLHTPGHTRGSVCYLVEREGLLFSGDSLFSNGTGVSRSVPFPGTDTHVYRQSLAMLATLQFEALCGGHGRPLVGGASDKVRALLQSKPDPPSWREFLGSVPRRLLRARSLSGEDA